MGRGSHERGARADERAQIPRPTAYHVPQLATHVLLALLATACGTEATETGQVCAPGQTCYGAFAAESMLIECCQAASVSGDVGPCCSPCSERMMMDMSASCCAPPGTGGSGHRRTNEDTSSAFTFTSCNTRCAESFPSFYSACPLEVNALADSVGAQKLSSFYAKCVVVADASGVDVPCSAANMVDCECRPPCAPVSAPCPPPSSGLPCKAACYCPPPPPPTPEPPRTGCDCGPGGRPSDCCHGMTAECIACTQCCSADEFCSMDGHFGSGICASYSPIYVSHFGCDGVENSGVFVDICGTCGGRGAVCDDGAGGLVCGDMCGVCYSDGSTCDDVG